MLFPVETHPTVTSNILLPTELDTAISPNPLRATITDVIKSGIEVPAARNVRPITCVKKRKSENVKSFILYFVTT